MLAFNHFLANITIWLHPVCFSFRLKEMRPISSCNIIKTETLARKWLNNNVLHQKGNRLSVLFWNMNWRPPRSSSSIIFSVADQSEQWNSYSSGRLWDLQHGTEFESPTWVKVCVESVILAFCWSLGCCSNYRLDLHTFVSLDKRIQDVERKSSLSGIKRWVAQQTQIKL